MRRGEKERIHSLFSETMTAENNNMQQTWKNKTNRHPWVLFQELAGRNRMEMGVRGANRYRVGKPRNWLSIPGEGKTCIPVSSIAPRPAVESKEPWVQWVRGGPTRPWRLPTIFSATVSRFSTCTPPYHFME
jgi:hypothetical protein